MLELLAYFPSYHRLSFSFTQLLITLTNQGHLCVLCQESPQSCWITRSCWPQNKDSVEGGSSSVQLGDQWLICIMDPVKAKHSSPPEPLDRASGVSAEPDTQFCEGLELETDSCLPNSQEIDVLNNTQLLDSLWNIWLTKSWIPVSAFLIARNWNPN